MKKFYRCKICGNIIGVINEGAGQLVCCGQPMNLLEPNTTDAAQEKHVPVYKLEGNKLTVTVGDTLHPMSTEHYIQWIAVSSGKHTQRIELTPECEPKACFNISEDKPFTVYAYCNLHGLWKSESK